MKRLCLTLLIPVVSAGCGSLAVNLPAGRMISSESLPYLKTRLGTGGGTQAAVEIAADASRRPFAPSTPKYVDNEPEVAWGKGALGLGQGFEALGKVGTIFGTSGLWMKYQVWGPDNTPESDQSSLALVAGKMFGSFKRGGDQNGDLGPAGFNWDANVESTASDFAVVYGHRMNESVIIYGGPFYTAWNYDAHIHQRLSDDGTSPEADYKFSGLGIRKGVSLALEWASPGKVKFVLVPEIVLSLTSWSGFSEERGWADFGVTTALQF